jgi:hypothetical protein
MIAVFFNRAMWILLLAAVIAGIGWLDATDRQAQQQAHIQYCEGVATWMVEAERGIDPLRRTGHPDWREIAEEECPGLRPAGPAETQTAQRQLARH